MAGYPVHRSANARRHALGVERPCVDPLDRTSGVGSDGFMNMSPQAQADDNPWHGLWLLPRANIQPGATTEHSVLPTRSGQSQPQ